MSGESRIAGVVNEIVAVERAADVNGLTFGEACVWPIMRRIHHFSRIEKDKKQPTSLAEIEDPAFAEYAIRMDDGGLERAADLARQKRILAGEEPCEALFFSRLLDHTDRVNGLYYNRLMDPYIRLARERGGHLKLEFSDETVLDQRFEPTVPLKLPDWQSPDYLKDMPTGVSGYAAVAAAFAAVTPQPPSFDQLASYLPRLWSRRNYFMGLMRRIRPRAVFVICYYSADLLALMWACKALGIPTVDIQHGQQGPYHGMYNHWTAAPPNGYHLLPDHFFCWGAPVKGYQEAGLPAMRLRPFSHVAGHPWIGLWREPNLLQPSDALAKFCADLEGRKVVMVGLQPTQALMSDALPGAMRRTPTWLWLLRLHPHQRYRIPEITAFLKAGGVENFEVELSTKAPLYALFRHVDHLLTQFSSVAWEAVAFDLPVTIVDKMGYDTYKSAIDAGVMHYALTADEIAAVLNENRPVKPAQDAFIEPSLDVTRAALAKVLG